MFARGVHLQRISGFQVQLFAHRLRDDDAASFVEDEMSVHVGIIIWVEPSINPIFNPQDRLGKRGRL